MASTERAYYPTKFQELERKFDTSVAFILQALRLVNSRGLVGYISSVTWETGENYARLRRTMFQQHGVVEVVNLPFDIFDAAYVETCAYVLSARPSREYRICVLPKKTKLDSLHGIEFTNVPSELIAAPDFRLVLNPAAETLFRRVSKTETFVPLGEITRSTQGLAANRFIRTREKKSGAAAFPFGEHCQAYRYDFLLDEISYTDLAEMPSLVPFYGTEPKVVIRRVINRQDRLDAALVSQRLVFKKDLNPFIPTHEGFSAEALLGLLNSRLLSFLYINSSAIATKDDFRQTTLAELRRLPIPRGLAKSPLHDRLVALVDKMLSLTPALRAAKDDAEKATLQNAVKKTDREIDQLVYQLYGLTPDEIALVEGTASPAPATETD